MPVLKHLRQSLYFDEIVAFKRADHFVDVVPHLGFDFSRTIGQGKGKVRLTALFLTDFLV